MIMKKKLLIAGVIAFAIGLLTYHCLLAAGAPNREPKDYSGKSNFGNIAATGLNVTGIPGYLELTWTNSSGTVYQSYLWVDSTGDLRIASSVTMAAYTSFPDVTSWEVGGVGSMGTVVGSQS